MIVCLIAWLIDKLQPILLISFGYFQFPIWRSKYNKVSRYKKNLSKDWLDLLQVQKLFGFVFSCHDMRKTNTTSETWAHAGWWLHGAERRGGPSSMQSKQAKGSFVNTTTPVLQVCPCSLSLSLSLQLIFASRSSVGFFSPLTSK